MRWLLLIVLAACLGGIYALKTNPSKKHEIVNHTINTRSLPDDNLILRLRKTASTLKEFAASRGYSESIFFITDMSLPSGKKRFFVYDALKDSVVASGLVAHGQGNGVSGSVQYSNEPGSYCTSEGIYKIGNAYNGSFGLAFKLYGLQPSNSNALQRFVVLHAHECVPGEDVYPDRICMSQGCPTVSTNFLKILSGYLKNTDKSILLEIIK